MNGTHYRAVFLGFGLVAIFLIIDALASHQNIRTLREDARWVAHTHEVMDGLERLLGILRDIETGQRGYVLTADRRFLEPYDAGLPLYPTLLARLRELLADNASQHSRLAKLTGLIDARVAESKQCIDLVNRGDVAAARRVVESSEGKRLMDEIRAAVGAMQREEQDLLVVRRDTTDRAYRIAISTVLLSVLFGLGALGVLAWVLHRHLSARARTAAVLHRQRELLRATLASIGDAVIATDAAGRVTFLNAVAESLTGWSQAEAGGLALERVFVIVNEQTRLPVENPALRAIAEGKLVGLANHTVLIAKNGAARPIDDSASPIRDERGGVAGAVLVFRDVTEQKRAEAELRGSEDRFRTLVEMIKDHAIFAMDRDGRPITWNLGVRQVLGFEEADFIGRDIVPLIFTPEDLHNGTAHGEFERAAATGSASDDRWMRRKDGTVFWANGITYSRRNESGEVIGFTKVMRDQTERKKMEDDLRKLAADLSEADRRKDEFLATLAHELRNPLAPIRNGLEILRLSGGNAAVDSVCEVMNRQLVHMIRLVDDLMDVSRITRNKLQLRLEPISLATVVESAVEACQPLLAAKGHDFSIALPDERVILNGDLTRLAQVFSNLLNNAAKYTERGGRIRLAATLDDDAIVVVVQDNGIGIPNAMLHCVFDLFAQVDGAAERSQGGLGIGLMLVKRLVELHGGTVEARSAGPKRGSEFRVRLPIVLPAVSESRDPAAQESPPGLVHRRILVVDDNRDSAESLSALVELMGNEVRVAYDGLAAVDLAATFHPDVVLLDIGLPKLNGYEACRRIRSLPGGERIVIVAQTGWGQEEDRRRAQESGFDLHLVKPIDSASLRRLLTSHFPAEKEPSLNSAEGMR